MSSLSTSSSVLHNLNELHIVQGRITYSSGVPSVTSNDGSLTVTDTGAGDVRITYAAFLTAPQVIASPLKGTHSATTHNAVSVETVSTTTCDFRWMEATGTATHPAMLSGSGTLDFASAADGVGETLQITVTGAALGDVAMVAAPVDLEDVIVTAYVQAADTVDVRMQNESGSTLDLASGTWTAVTFTPAAAGAAVASTSPDPADDEAIMFTIIGVRNR
jgi:hypothetical protein